MGAMKVPVNAGRYVRSYRNYFRNRHWREDHGSWTIWTNPAHDFGIVVHYTTLAAQLHELEAQGASPADLRRLLRLRALVVTSSEPPCFPARE